MTEPAALRFSKMHGAGNDFVVLDLRGGQPAPGAALAAQLADRHTGVGCDQILTIEAPRDPGSVASYRIWNSDGSAAGQCGNGARCVAAWLVRDGVAGNGDFQMDSPAGTHQVQRTDAGFAVAMGVPRWAPAQIPLVGFPAAQPAYTVTLGDAPVTFGAVSMGNPHAVVQVADVASAPVLALGPALQAHAAFPESVNVGFAQVISRQRIALRVYERGVGETLACGSGACAAAVVLMRAGLVERSVSVALPGGTLQIDWPDDSAEVVMSGPATFVFEGAWTP
ncbi:diaminopimelate epimerase [Pseudoxanthomonas sp.]|uniref:diaminopimelate epimerase n=1 Tax=Pseudoxanthomonas sp. TaxID=1871049 RepID=UPI002636BBC0|nr:diaminopimelate epimerase [Pseudoxanthomonas sp.]WDS35723.1 MAG: diaminopimelate epimerase [Pseudoxanthomonas sp.]